MAGRTVAIGVLAAAALAAGGWFLFGAGASAPGPEVVPESDDAAGDPTGMGAGFAVRPREGPAAAPAGATYRIRGTVVDAAGAPVAGVRVTARRTGAVYDMYDPKSWGDWGGVAAFARSTKEIDTPSPEDEKPNAEGKSGDDGAFLLETAETGTYEVAARAAAPRAGTKASVGLTPAKPEAKVKLTLLSGSRLSGRVVDASDQGIAAVVKASWDLPGTGQGFAPPPAKTDATGAFVFDAVPAGKGVLSVTLPGRMALSGLEVVTPYEGTYVIRVGGGGVLKGRIADLRGQPVAGADVVATVGTFAAALSRDPTGCRSRAKSEPDGTWRMEGVLPGKVSALSVMAAGYTLLQQTVPRATWAGAEVKAGQETAIDVVLKKGGAVTGRVTESGTGAPLPDVEVRLIRGEGYQAGPLTASVSDAEGRYRFDDVALGKHVLLPQSATHWSNELESAATTTVNYNWNAGDVRSAPPSLTVVLTVEGETAERDLEMRRGLVVKGRVVNPEGAPVEGAKVRSTAASNLQWQWGLPWFGADFGLLATSGADGAFEAKGLAPRESWVLSASKDGFVGVPSDPFRLAADAAPPTLTLKLAPGASIAGRVIDADGKPQPGWTVYYWSMEGQNSSGTVTATTEEDGAYVLKGLPKGKGQVQANGTGGYVNQQVEALAVGENRTGVDLKVEKTAEITGTVVDADGNPVPGVGLQAMAVGGGRSGGWASTRGDGSFTLNGMAKGKTQIHVNEATDQGYSASVAVGDPVEAPTSGVRLTYTPKKRTAVTGRVTDAAGKPVPLCVVSAGSNQNRMYGGQTPDEAVGGEFVRALEGAPPYVLSVSAPRDARGRPLNLKPKQVTVTDPKEPVVVALEAGVELAGRVLAPDGKGVLGVTVRGGTVSSSTDEEGRFRVAGLTSDADVDVTVQAPAKYRPVPPQKAKPGDKELVIRLVLGSVIAGRLVGPDGKPITTASVTAQWKDANGVSGTLWASAGEGGVFRIEGLPDDSVSTLTATVWSYDGSSRMRPARATDVRAGAVDVVMRVEAGCTIEGRVVTPDGSPGQFSYVVAQRIEGPQDGSGMAYSQPLDRAEGTFSLGGLEAGATYSLTVSGPTASSYGGTDGTRVEAPAKNVRLVMTPPAKLAGRVEGMLPGVEYWVMAWPASGGPEGTGQVSVKAGADGAFSLDVAPGKDYFVGAMYGMTDDRYALAGPVRGNSGDVVLRFQPGLSIEGRVDDAPAGSYVTAKGERWRANAKVETDGHFRLRGLPPGKYSLAVMNNTGATIPAESADAGATGLRLKGTN